MQVKTSNRPIRDQEEAAASLPVHVPERSRAVAPFSPRRYRVVDGQSCIGLSCVTLGSSAFALMCSGYLNGHEIIPILLITSAGLFITALWYGISGQFQYSWAFGGFAGLNTTYAILQLGIWHSWFGIPNGGIPHTLTAYAGIWSVLFFIAAYAVVRDSRSLGAILVAAGLGLLVAIAANLTNSIAIVHWDVAPCALIALISVYEEIRIIRTWHRRLLQKTISGTH